MRKSYIFWALLSMVGYSMTALLAKLATATGRFSSFFVLMVSSALMFLTSISFTVLRGDMRALTWNDLSTADGSLALGTGVALVVAVVPYFLALSLGPASVVVPIYGMFIVGGAVLGLIFLHEPFTLRKGIGICFAIGSIYLIAGQARA